MGRRSQHARDGNDRYSTFLSLSGDGVARFEVDPPLAVGAPEEDQVHHLLRHSRVAECNELFARFYGRGAAEMVGLAMGDFVPAHDSARLHGVREFIRAGYRLVYVEEEHALGEGRSRWVSASALGAVEEGRVLEFWLCLREVTERKRGELDRERRGRILEAVAFSAARLLQPGSWRTHANEVLARLGEATEAARAWIGDKADEPDGSARLVFRFAWGTPGERLLVEDPRLRGGVPLRAAGLGRLEAELRAGRPLVSLVRDLSESERALPASVGSRSLAAVPIFSNGEWWGFLGFGETRYERVWSAPEVEALKAAAAVLGAAIEREGADRALRESEERFERLSAAAFEGVAITDRGVFLDGNEQLAAMLGCRLADLAGRPVQDFVAPEDLDLVRSQIASGSEGPYQHVARRADGSRFPVEVRARSLPYEGRTVRVSVLRDVSARVEAEERQRLLEAELRQAAEEWRQTFDALDLGIVLADAEGRVVRLNRGARERVGRPSLMSAPELRLEALGDGEPWHTILDLHERVGERQASVVAEARDPVTRRAFYLLGSPWFRGEGEPPWRVITFRDVTDFTSMQEQLRHARTMEAMGALVAGVAHEVRNPLFAISATVDAMDSMIGPGPDLADHAALLRSNVTRLTELTRDLLDYGRPSALQRTSTSLADVVRRAARACSTLARQREIAIDQRVAPDLPRLSIDSARVEQAFENLMANAIQHAPAGSVVRVVGVLETDGAEAFVRCAVEDDGPGLPAENLARVFEPFFTRRKGGTGLGLSIVQRVVEAHGGFVVAENGPLGGARFTVRLPVPRGPEGAGRG
jgi:PAS domain S-box-containing protein